MSKRASAKKKNPAGAELNPQDDLTTPAASAAVAGTKRPATRSKAPAAATEKNDGKKRQRTEKPSAVAASSEENERRVKSDTPATLFEDGLHIVFSFLEDRQFIKSQPWLVGRPWHAAAVSMRSRRMLTTIRTPDQVTLLGASPLALRHVTRLTLKGPHDGSKKVIIADDALLAAACTGPLRDRLTEIILTRWSSEDSESDQSLNCDSLLKLPHLDTLELRAHYLTAPQQKVIKQLASLRKLTHTNESEECDLSDLLAPPHSLHQLVDLETQECFSAVAMQLVVDQLPQLTRLVCDVNANGLPLLAGLKHLTEVNLQLSLYERPRHFTDIFSEALPFGRVRKLTLRSFYRIDEEVEWFLRQMPFLEDLSLTRVDLSDLKGFSSSAKLLTSLSLVDCRGVSFKMLDDLAACPLLTSLSVRLAADEPRLKKHQIEELQDRLPDILYLAVTIAEHAVSRRWGLPPSLPRRPPAPVRTFLCRIPIAATNEVTQPPDWLPHTAKPSRSFVLSSQTSHIFATYKLRDSPSTNSSAERAGSWKRRWLMFGVESKDEQDSELRWLSVRSS